MGTYYFYNIIRPAWLRAQDKVQDAMNSFEGDYKDAAYRMDYALHWHAEDVLDGILWYAPSGYDAPRSFYSWLYRMHQTITTINYHEPEPHYQALHPDDPVLAPESNYERRCEVFRIEQQMLEKQSA